MIFQLLQAKRDQIETARAYVEVLRDYWTLRAEAEQLFAGRVPRRGPFTGADADDNATNSAREQAAQR